MTDWRRAKFIIEHVASVHGVKADLILIPKWAERMGHYRDEAIVLILENQVLSEEGVAKIFQMTPGVVREAVKKVAARVDRDPPFARLMGTMRDRIGNILH